MNSYTKVSRKRISSLGCMAILLMQASYAQADNKAQALKDQRSVYSNLQTLGGSGKSGQLADISYLYSDISSLGTPSDVSGLYGLINPLDEYIVQFGTDLDDFEGDLTRFETDLTTFEAFKKLIEE